CAFTLRNSSAAQASTARWTSGSSRSGNAFFSLAIAIPSRVERARVDDRGRGPIGHDRYHQIIDHRGPPLVVEFDAVLRQLAQRHLDHADGALDDLLPGSDDRECLLPLEHRACDLRRIREMAEPRLHNLD